MKELLSVWEQGGIGLHERFSSSSFLSNPLSCCVDISCFSFSHPPFDRVPGDVCLSDDLGKSSSFLGLHRQILPPLLLIEALSHVLVLVFS